MVTARNSLISTSLDNERRERHHILQPHESVGRVRVLEPLLRILSRMYKSYREGRAWRLLYISIRHHYDVLVSRMLYGCNVPTPQKLVSKFLLAFKDPASMTRAVGCGDV